MQPIADTVLYEGYVLYPYRADDTKNRVRWQFGVLAPPAHVAADPSERSSLRAELLLDGRPSRVSLRVRFLQVQRRTVHQDTASGEQEVARLDAGDTAYLPFDEAVSHELDLDVDVASAAVEGVLETRVVPGGVEHEPVPGGRLRRERLLLTAAVTATAESLAGPYGVTRLRVDVANVTPWAPGPSPRREEALRRSLVAAHLLVCSDRGRFLSLTDPPEWATGYVAACENDGVWPVLADSDGRADMVLCSPIILPDRPQVAPESTTQFFDGTEMDEMLSLRALTLTDAEKRAVRGTDPRAAEMLDRVENLPPELMDRLHGAIRYLSSTRRSSPATSHRTRSTSTGYRYAREAGCCCARVREGPTPRTSSSRAARPQWPRWCTTWTVGTIWRCSSTTTRAQDLALVQGRFLYFAPDEVEPIGVGR